MVDLWQSVSSCHVGSALGLQLGGLGFQRHLRLNFLQDFAVTRSSVCTVQGVSLLGGDVGEPVGNHSVSRGIDCSLWMDTCTLVWTLVVAVWA